MKVPDCPQVTRIGVKNITDGKHKNALTQLSALDQYARKHGISIICVDALYDETGTPINGEYRTGNNIVISLDADGGLYMPVVGHELFHYIESINTEDAKALAELIIDTLKVSKGAEWLSQRREEYEGYGYKGEEIDSEIAADFFGAAVTEKEFERQVKSAELNKSFTQKVIDKVKEIVAELKEIMQKLRGQRLIYDAALDMDTEMLDFFVDNFERILDQANTETSSETKNTAENSGVKKQNKISVEMNDAERAEVLRNSEIDLVEHKFNVEDLNATNVLSLQQTYRANAARVLKKLAEKFGVFDKTYFNKNISLDFSYSRGSLKESVNKQGNVSTDFYDFAKMLFVFNDVVNNAVPIEAHTDKYAGTERANQNLKYDYVLLSAFSDGDYTIPVEMHIKEFSNKDPNKLYVSVTLGKIKTEDGILAHPSKQKNISANVTPPSSKINVAQLIAKVNPGFSDFYKYIPSELLTEAQISSKTVALDDEKYRLGVLRGEDVSGMLRKKAENAGYSPDDSWKMDHRAPNADDDTALDMDTDMLDFFVDNFERILDQANTETSTETKNTAENSGVKRQNSIENKAAHGTAQTELTKEYQAAVDRVLNMQDTTADNLIIGYTPKLMKDMGMPALPFVIGTGHVYSAAKTEAEAKSDGNYRKGVHYHGLGDTVVKNIYEQLQDPVMIIAAKDVNGNASPLRSTHSVVAIVDVGTANNSLLLPVEITAERSVKGSRIDVNALSSIYERDVASLAKEAIALENAGDIGVYYAKKEALNLIGAGVRFPVQLQRMIASNPIVRSFDEKVNRKISDVTQSLQFKRWFGDWQNHPETIAPELLNADGTPKVFYHGAKTYEERFVVQDRLADEVNEEALDLFGEIMAASPLVTKTGFVRSPPLCLWEYKKRIRMTF